MLGASVRIVKRINKRTEKATSLPDCGSVICTAIFGICTGLIFSFIWVVPEVVPCGNVDCENEEERTRIKTAKIRNSFFKLFTT